MEDNKFFQGRAYGWTWELAGMIYELRLDHEAKMKLWYEHIGKCEEAYHANVEEYKKKIKGIDIFMPDALRWAQNELSHDLDETSCCQRWCQSCKRIQENNVWKQWWNNGINPVDAVLTQRDSE